MKFQMNAWSKHCLPIYFFSRLTQKTRRVFRCFCLLPAAGASPFLTQRRHADDELAISSGVSRVQRIKCEKLTRDLLRVGRERRGNWELYRQESGSKRALTVTADQTLDWTLLNIMMPGLKLCRLHFVYSIRKNRNLWKVWKEASN